MVYGPLQTREDLERPIGVKSWRSGQRHFKEGMDTYAHYGSTRLIKRMRWFPLTMNRVEMGGYVHKVCYEGIKQKDVASIRRYGKGTIQGRLDGCRV